MLTTTEPVSVEAALWDFHKAYDLDRRHHPISMEPTEQFGTNYDRLFRLRENLVEEEYKEFREAMIKLRTARITEEKEDALVGVADAICDLVYVAVGTAVSFGIPFDKCFAEVQRSNMSKLGEDGKPIVREEDGKILKGPFFSPPALARIIYGTRTHTT